VGLLKKYHLRENSHANPFVFNGHFSRARVFQQPHSPYFIPYFIQKREGKTVNVNLGHSRAAAVSKAIRENRRLERLLS
jgi:hypothetical protein